MSFLKHDTKHVPQWMVRIPGITIDGAPHLVWMVIIMVITIGLSRYYAPLLSNTLAGAAVILFAFYNYLAEVNQENRMDRTDTHGSPWNPLNWNQARHQDVGLPLVGGALMALANFHL